jgi:hypothetical protein
LGGPNARARNAFAKFANGSEMASVPHPSQSALSTSTERAAAKAAHLWHQAQRAWGRLTGLALSNKRDEMMTLREHEAFTAQRNPHNFLRIKGVDAQGLTARGRDHNFQAKLSFKKKTECRVAK